MFTASAQSCVVSDIIAQNFSREAEPEKRPDGPKPCNRTRAARVEIKGEMNGRLQP